MLLLSPNYAWFVPKIFNLSAAQWDMYKSHTFIFNNIYIHRSTKLGIFKAIVPLSFILVLLVCLSHPSHLMNGKTCEYRQFQTCHDLGIVDSSANHFRHHPNHCYPNILCGKGDIVCSPSGMHHCQCRQKSKWNRL